MDCGEFVPESKEQCIPNFPFFDEQPEYTDNRYPFTNALNDSCEHYKTNKASPGNSCQECIYFKDAVDVTCCLCAQYEREGFRDGIIVGFRLFQKLG